jgi:small subunit ribosomal protein S13
MLYFLQTPVLEKVNLRKGLQSIYGVGEHSAQLSIKLYGLLKGVRGKNLRPSHKRLLTGNFAEFPRTLGENLKQIYMANCQRLIDIKSYRGRRHQYAYPVRGQRTRTNAKNQKRLHKRWIISAYAVPIKQKEAKNKKTLFKKAKPKTKPKAKQKTKKK